ncbi:hypothetical protein GGR52DRAFT_591850 [Hypoxylon sp. FL1284]|nr:hypothetical protein GGR52DRAFT_591850 [Hypoxylon sp. FL1284]
MLILRFFVTLFVLVCTMVTVAASIQYCPVQSVCYQVAIPSGSAKADSGNIYLQLRAPVSYSWIGFGMGQQMNGSNIFVVYQDGTGNVTISPRTGNGHLAPEHNAAMDVELLDGSGVTDGIMIANVRCGSCSEWPGSNMSFSSAAADYIEARKEGDAINSTLPDELIDYHDAHSQWQLDLTEAIVEQDSNPFVDVDDDNNNDNDNGNDNGNGNGNDSGNSNDNDNGSVEPVLSANEQTLMAVHGIIMSVAIACLLPLGAALMDILGILCLHAAVQMLGFFLMLVGTGLGAAIARNPGVFEHSVSHIVLGAVACDLMLIQVFLGMIYHSYFSKHESLGWTKHLHVWFGRFVIVASIANGALGLQLVKGDPILTTIYVLVATATIALQVGTSEYHKHHRRKVDASQRTADEGAAELADEQLAHVPHFPGFESALEQFPPFEDHIPAEQRSAPQSAEEIRELQSLSA